MNNYYLITSQGDLETIENVINFEESDNQITIYTNNKTFTYQSNDIVIHGNQEHWKKILELFNCMDQVITRRVNTSLGKATALGYLMGSIN